MVSRSGIRSTLILVAGLACVIANFGCATVVAMKIPGPVLDDSISLGMHRSEVEVVLRYAKRTEFPEGSGTTVRYEYANGPHQASKGRVVLYIAGDIFTIFLSELVFWPIELYATGRTERISTAYYDPDNRLGMWTIARPGGKDVLVTMGELPKPETAPPVAAGPVDDIVQGVDDPEAPISEEMPQVPIKAEPETDDTPTQSTDAVGEAPK